MKKKQNRKKLILLAVAALFLLSGCGESPDIELMERGLTKSGMAADQASCFATAMDGEVKGEIYNNMAKLLNKGETEKDAVNRTRRKFGADWKTGMEKAREGCIK